MFGIYIFFAGVVYGGFSSGLYYAILAFGSLFFLVLLFVLLYHYLFSKKFNRASLWLGFLLKSLSLVLVSFLALFVWALLEFIVTSGFHLDMKWILEDYRGEYLGYMPAVVLLALLIPPGHYFFRPSRSEEKLKI